MLTYQISGLSINRDQPVQGWADVVSQIVTTGANVYNARADRKLAQRMAQQGLPAPVQTPVYFPPVQLNTPQEPAPITPMPAPRSSASGGFASNPMMLIALAGVALVLVMRR